MTTAPAVYDLLLKGGNLLDPGQGIVNHKRDVAFQGGQVAEVAENISPERAASVVDITGKVVTPGLIDLHGHFYHGGTGSAVHADQNCLSAGATTGVDAGSSGFLNLGAMRDYVFPAHRTRLLAFLHIGAVGLAANRVLGGGLQDLRIIDVDQTADAVKDNPGLLFGIKVRMELNAVAHWDAPEAMRRARAAADQSGGKLMVHVSGTPIPLPQILEFMGPGGHCYPRLQRQPRGHPGPPGQHPPRGAGGVGAGRHHGPGPRRGPLRRGGGQGRHPAGPSPPIPSAPTSICLPPGVGST